MNFPKKNLLKSFFKIWTPRIDSADDGDDHGDNLSQERVRRLGQETGIKVAFRFTMVPLKAFSESKTFKVEKLRYFSLSLLGL